MKKSFVINPPRPGRSTATLVTHAYDRSTRRTRTVYLGSFSAGLDPSTLPADGHIPTGSHRYGISVSKGAADFDSEDLAVIKDWLELHGTYRREEAAHHERMRAEQDRRNRETAMLRLQVEEELRPRVERELRDLLEHERRAAELEPLEAAMSALERAAEHVVQLAAKLRSDGYEVSNARRASALVGANANPLDRLQADANRVRRDGLARFEMGCKAARIMAKRTGQR